MAIPTTNGGLRERLWWLGDILEVEDRGEGLRFAGIGVDRGGGHGGKGGLRSSLGLRDWLGGLLECSDGLGGSHL